MRKGNLGQIMIECPNTIFHLYVNDGTELSKIEIFMGNIRNVKHLGVNDIYNWCNRQGISYNTRFNYHKEFTLSKTIKSYMFYYKHKIKYKYQFSF